MFLKEKVITEALVTYMDSNEPREVQRNPFIKMKGKPISYDKEFRYLGFILDDQLSFRKDIQYAAGKGKQHFHMIRRAAKAN